MTPVLLEFYEIFGDGFCLGFAVDVPQWFSANCFVWTAEIDCRLQSNLG